MRYLTIVLKRSFACAQCMSEMKENGREVPYIKQMFYLMQTCNRLELIANARLSGWKASHYKKHTKIGVYIAASFSK